MMNRITQKHVEAAVSWLNGVSRSEYKAHYFSGECHLYNKDGRLVAHGPKSYIYNIADAMYRAIIDNEE